MVKLRSGKEIVDVLQKEIQNPQQNPQQQNPFKDDYITSYNNRTKFLLVHKDNLIFNQKWVYLEGLVINRDHGTIGRFNEYFLDANSPIKAAEWNGKYWIIDGHHRVHRGLMLGYKHFLVECNDMYRPCSFERSTSIKIFEKRYPDLLINDINNFVEVPRFFSDEQEILVHKFTEIYPDINIVRYISKI
jgi:hypothetical protein